MSSSRHDETVEKEGIGFLADSSNKCRLRCRWIATRHTHFVFVGLVFQEGTTSNTAPIACYSDEEKNKGQQTADCPETVSTLGIEFLRGAFCDFNRKSNYGRRIAGLIVPTMPGYIARSDIVPLRLVDYELVETAVELAQPLQQFPGYQHRNWDDVQVSHLIAMAAGGFFIRRDFITDDSDAVLSAVQVELIDRFSFPWIVAEMMPRRQRTLVIVEGGAVTPDHHSLAARIYPAARALGLQLIVLDQPGHWLENGAHNDLRESFIPVHLTTDCDRLAINIFEALRNQVDRIGGLVSFYDEYQVGVAQAAERLGLPTISPDAFRIATNKFETSVAAGRRSFRGHSVEDAKDISHRDDLMFPAIVKPSSGWMSEGVFKVAGRSELLQAVSQIDFSRHGAGYVVEAYCDGPEVDFNVVMYDGEMLFHEIGDDFPKAAEGYGVTSDSSFLDTDIVEPSNLPELEKIALRDGVYDLLCQCGLMYSTFHVEGRVQNSSMEFREDKQGMIDLRSRSGVADDTSAKPRAFVLDINPRPPGHAVAVQPRDTYGIDYHALSMLIALRDTKRVHALSLPFLRGNQ